MKEKDDIYINLVEWIAENAYLTYNKGKFKWYVYKTKKEHTNEELLKIYYNDRGKTKETVKEAGSSYQKV